MGNNKQKKNQSVESSVDQETDLVPEQAEEGVLFDGSFERTEAEKKPIWSDTFKLKVAPYIKRIGIAEHPNKEPLDFVEAEHVHFYRTYDSDGKRMDRSASIGGHFHVIKTKPNAKDPTKPVIVSVSGPMRLAKKTVQGRRVIVAIPLNDYDHHTHEVEYLKSGKVLARVMNAEAHKVMAYESAKGAPPAGAAEL